VAAIGERLRGGEERRVDRAADGEIGGRRLAADAGDDDDRSLGLGEAGPGGADEPHVPEELEREAVLQASSLSARKSPRVVAPALATTMSMPPKALTVASTSVAGAAASRRSATWASARPPALTTSSARARNASPLRAASATAQPARASSAAISAPMPRLAPVTTATFPVSAISIS